jgi:hypothetical protein
VRQYARPDVSSQYQMRGTQKHPSYTRIQDACWSLVIVTEPEEHRASQYRENVGGADASFDCVKFDSVVGRAKRFAEGRMA